MREVIGRNPRAPRNARVVELQPGPAVKLDRRANTAIEVEAPRQPGALQQSASFRERRMDCFSVERRYVADVAREGLQALADGTAEDGGRRTSGERAKRGAQALGVEEQCDAKDSTVQQAWHVWCDQHGASVGDRQFGAADVGFECASNGNEELHGVRSMGVTCGALGAVDTPPFHDPDICPFPHQTTVAEWRSESQRDAKETQLRSTRFCPLMEQV